MIYIRKNMGGNTTTVLYRGGPGEWYSKSLNRWSPVPPHLSVTKTLDEAAEKGHSLTPGSEEPIFDYIKITEEEAVMILFQPGVLLLKYGAPLE